MIDYKPTASDLQVLGEHSEAIATIQKYRQAERLPITMVVKCHDERGAQLLALFEALDERGKLTTLALLATAVKLHPKVGG